MRVSLRADKAETITTVAELLNVLATVPDTSTVHLYQSGGLPELVIRVEDVKRTIPGESAYSTSVDARGNRHWYRNGVEIK